MKLKSTYASWGVFIGLAYVLMQLATIGFYYSLPPNAARWTDTLTFGMPWLDGLRSIRSLNVVGERLSFCLIVSYWPFAILGAFTLFREMYFRSSAWPVRTKWHNVLGVLTLAGVLVVTHYFTYWHKVFWRDSPSLMHPVIAAIMPFFIGFVAFGLMLRLKKILQRTEEIGK